MSSEWYAVHTKSRHEQKVHERLLEKSIHSFLPKIEVWSRRKDRRKRIRIPLFSGYLFVRVLMDNYTGVEILKTPGVAYILGNGTRYIPIPEDQIASIQILLQNDVLLSPHPYLKVGQRVRIVNGPLTGCEGILLREKPGKEKLIVSVDLLKRSISAEIHEADIEPIT
jgi:transcriptional antiterminator NusG